MKCVVMAAGYATRLYPLTENFPKPLLKVRGKAILDWLLDDIHALGLVDEFVIISNHRFARCFEEWKQERSLDGTGLGEMMTIVDDGTVSNESRLGAVRDIQFAVDALKLDDDMLVIAGDNLLEFSFGKFVDYAKEKGTSCLMRYFEGDMAKLVKHGVVLVDEEQVVTGMTEKSPDPPSPWCCPALYYFLAEDVKRIPEAMADGCGTDAPGNFCAWLCQKTKVYAMEMPAKPYDIGDLATYEKAQEEYRGIV